ncbi:MAG: MmcQ/YjbR family DNA-binding protein [Alphaproteobacteria bacterium]|nr:MmcQ/YjbR family DNA-binding protein [Alphaproteobacteria bacterium]
MTKAQHKKIALSFPGGNEKPSYGKPAFFIEKKFFTRWRDEENSIVLIVDGIDERDMLLEADPTTFFITEHYRNYPSVLARAAALDTKTLRGMLERHWHKIAPKKLRAEAKPSAKTKTKTKAKTKKPNAKKI